MWQILLKKGLRPEAGRLAERATHDVRAFVAEALIVRRRSRLL
jgi:hypothetical protein